MSIERWSPIHSIIRPLSGWQRRCARDEVEGPEELDQLSDHDRCHGEIEQDQTEEQAALDDPAIVQPVGFIGPLTRSGMSTPC
jgi:hypothetical protein